LVLALAGFTDVLDGYLARKNGQATQLGAMLDPLADKTMILVVVLSFVLKGLIPWEAAIAMFVRDLGMIISSTIFHLRGKLTVPANVMGKLTTVLLYVAFLFIVLEYSFDAWNFTFAVGFLWMVIVFSFITSVIYIFQFKLLNQKTTQE